VVEEIFDIRIALEGYAARLATPLLSDEDLAMLIKMHQEAEASIDTNPELALAADRNLHQSLIDKCQNSRIARILAELYDLVQLFRAQQGRRTETVKSLMEHRGIIIDALRKRDEELAEKLMREHIRSVKDKVMADTLYNE
jgi:DNA-binding GntR family transcriptional regulator